MRHTLAAVLANVLLWVILFLLAFAAACGDEIHYYYPPPFDAGPQDGASIDAPPPDAGPADASPPDAYEPPSGSFLGQPCEPLTPFSCTAPFICGQDSRVCTISCNVSPVDGDHEWCTYLTDPEHVGVCSRLEGLEGRCYVGCNGSFECPTGTFCIRPVDPGGNSPRAQYCSR